MISSLWSAVSGMTSTGTALDVVSNNISNMNTSGYKANRANFGDVLSQYVGTYNGQIGQGTQVISVSTFFTQGSLINTGNVYDMAVDGDGFFVVKDTSTGATMYTRAGAFNVDKNGYLITSSGMRVQGYMGTDVNATSSNTNNGILTNIKIQSNISMAQRTTLVTTGVNLNSHASVVSAAFTLDGNGDGINNDPANYSYSRTTTVYDSQGGSHEVTGYFTKLGDNSWEVHYAYQAGNNPSTTASSPILTMATGTTQTLTFNTSGALVSDGTSSTSNTNPTLYFDFGTSVASPQGIVFDYGKSINEGGIGFSGTTQLAEANQMISSSQNGYAAGSVKSVTISDDGVITATLSNGQIATLGQMALARFNSEEKLTKISGNMYMASKDSGTPIVNIANSDGLGRVVSGSLEASNVDLSTEFVNMISYQRSFEANSKGIQTVNEMLQTLNSLK
ncbi:flagellar basal-body rod protein FlgF [Candidatus Magnetominusculus xianensis]|uniref:Flagellar hook protein FlgE n=1 Tax=Candidatus Magnetominusculus xianensis TaxID=1748249 RepID=A0ABR5SJ94_9BACT|nr:flagellar basal-body rod protein FlgF [Candidatus Magnetominusculus xianensis]KWT85131.1 flagellar hook protein FlgE [Candidatus Magnetominusculus xianensis]MBF0405389.1 flagellar basal-body rod protein FlgF [Nitrospirota bacterium]